MCVCHMCMCVCPSRVSEWVCDILSNLSKDLLKDTKKAKEDTTSIEV